MIVRCGPTNFRHLRCGKDDFRKVKCTEPIAVRMGVKIRLPWFKIYTIGMDEAIKVCPPHGVSDMSATPYFFSFHGLLSKHLTLQQYYNYLINPNANPLVVTTPLGAYRTSVYDIEIRAAVAPTHLEASEVYKSGARWVRFDAAARLCIPNMLRYPLRVISDTYKSPCCSKYHSWGCAPYNLIPFEGTNANYISGKPPWGLVYEGMEPWDYGSVIEAGAMDAVWVQFALEVKTDLPIAEIPTHTARAFGEWLYTLPETYKQYEYTCSPSSWTLAVEGGYTERTAALGIVDVFYTYSISPFTTYAVQGNYDWVMRVQGSVQGWREYFGYVDPNAQPCCQHKGVNGMGPYETRFHFDAIKLTDLQYI